MAKASEVRTDSMTERREPLARREIGPWRWIGPGMRFARVEVPEDPDHNVILLRVGPGKAVQGNLDPTLLFAGPDVIEREVRRVVDDGDKAIAAGAIGHIFNLGHGVLPKTDPDALTRVVELVHSL